MIKYKGGVVFLNAFLILYAPFIVVVASLAVAFWFALKGEVVDE